jgi:hypothetical protein
LHKIGLVNSGAMKEQPGGFRIGDWTGKRGMLLGAALASSEEAVSKISQLHKRIHNGGVRLAFGGSLSEHTGFREGDAKIGQIEDTLATQCMWLLIAIIMVVPIVMIVITVLVPYPHVRLLNLIFAGLVFAFNIVSFPYKGHYDNFLIVLSLLMNGLVFYYSWIW